MAKIIFIFLLIIGASVNAQKIKIKKGSIIIDKNEIGSIEKIKTKTDTYFQFTNIKGEKFCKAKQTTIPSLLFKGDKTYTYSFFYEDKIKDSIAITQKNYWLNSKRAAEYLQKIGLLNEKGFQDSLIMDVVKKTPKYPKWISESLHNEKETLKSLEYKVNREINDTLVLQKLDPEESRGQISGLPSSVTKINIFQKNGAEEILIGYSLYEIEKISNYTYYFLFNSKGVPLSFYDSFKYKIYYPLQEFSLNDNKLQNIEGVSNIIQEMALDQIKANKL